MVDNNKNMSSSADNTTSDRTGKDITNEFEVDKDDVELYSIEELVPSSFPMTIPYLEVYRTNELEYIPYLSPYNVGVQSSSSDSSSSSTSATDPNATTDPNNPNATTDPNNPNATTDSTTGDSTSDSSSSGSTVNP